MDRIAENLGETHVISKLSAEFSPFLGADAIGIVTGLRNGTPIISTRTVPRTTSGSSQAILKTVISPPTGKMGFGDVFIALAVARQQLSRVGVTRPTPAQLQTALLGGTITSGGGETAKSTNLQGVLTLRSQSMGWGQIAQQLGSKLGPVVSSLKATNHSLVMAAVSPKRSGIVNTGGEPMEPDQSVSSPSGITTGHEPDYGISEPSPGDTSHRKGHKK